MRVLKEPCANYRDSIYSPGTCFDCRRVRDMHREFGPAHPAYKLCTECGADHPSQCLCVREILGLGEVLSGKIKGHSIPVQDVHLPEDDPLVHHPSHYTSTVPGIETIEVTEHFNFNRGNAIKYIWRAGAKGNEIQDLEKAAWYINREIERLKKG